MIKLKKVLESSARDRLKKKIKTTYSDTLPPFTYRPDQKMRAKAESIFDRHNEDIVSAEYAKLHRKIIAQNPPKGWCLYFLINYLDNAGQLPHYTPDLSNRKKFYPIQIDSRSPLRVFVPPIIGKFPIGDPEEIESLNNSLAEIEEDLNSVIRKYKDQIPEDDPVAGTAFLLTYLKQRNIATAYF